MTLGALAMIKSAATGSNQGEGGDGGGSDPPLSTRRETILQALQPLVGLEPQSDLYRKTVYPFDDPQTVIALSNSQSGCGLVTEVGWRAANIDAPAIWMPYRERLSHGGVYFAVSAEYNVALKCGAWVSCKSDMPLPQPGDAVIIGCHGCPGTWGIGTSDIQHEFTVEKLGPLTDKGFPMTSIDGGQPGVRRRERFLVQVGNDWWAADISNGNGKLPAKGRKLYGYTCVDRLPGKANV